MVVPVHAVDKSQKTSSLRARKLAVRKPAINAARRSKK